MRRVLAIVVLALSACDQIETNTPRPYACDRAAGDAQCTGGWHCGINGVCQDPKAPLPYDCASDNDCGAGWHCGPNSVCYDRLDAGAISCRADAGDCAPGWRCSFQAVCQSQAVGAAYPCRSDDDCEQQWRCGPFATCVDASAEALRPAPTPTTLTIDQIGPKTGPVIAPPRSVLGTLDGGILTVQYGSERFYGYDAVFGFYAVSDSSATAYSPVRGAPDWAMWLSTASTPAVALQSWHSHAVLSQLTNTDGFGLQSQLHGDLVPTAAASTAAGIRLLAADGDTVWGSDPAQPLLLPIATPLFGAPIESLIALGPGTRATNAFFHAWVLARGRVFEVASPDSVTWTSAELQPLVAPSASSLWNDGARGRVGFADGTVRSLPNELLLAPPLPGPAQDFVSLCQTTFALAAAGSFADGGMAHSAVYELTTGSGPVGAWVPLPMPNDPFGILLDGARLFSTGQELLVFAGNGTVVRVQAPGCP